MYIQQLHETNRWFSNQYLCVVFSLDYKVSGHFVPWSDRSKSDRSNQ